MELSDAHSSDQSARSREATYTSNRRTDRSSRLRRRSASLLPTRSETLAAFGFSAQAKPSEAQILLQYELLYFSSHIVLRTVVSLGFTEAQIRRLQHSLVHGSSGLPLTAFFIIGQRT